MIGRVARRVLGSAAGAVDRAATLAIQAHSTVRRTEARPEPPGVTRSVDLLGGIAELYSEPQPGEFFLPVRGISPVGRRAPNDFGVAQALDLSWPSEYRPFRPGLRDSYARGAENASAAVRMLTAKEKRPVAILIHGYMAGNYQVEQRLWPVQRFLACGYDVALFTLPFHGVRGQASRRSAPRFPSSDPWFNNEGFRQAIADLRDFVNWLRAAGYPDVGVMGMSLGGYTAALLASLADFAREQGQLSAAPALQAEEHSLLERIYRVVSPLERAPLISAARTLVVAAKADRITPVAHARKLAAHFAAPLVSWHGGHLLQLGRNAAFRRVETLLRELRGRRPSDFRG